jgi:UDP-2,3-diacylglucosamine pyrophosphatase LpxH
MPKEVDLGDLRRLISEGPAGEEKLRRLTEEVSNLAETLSLVAKRQRPYEVAVADDGNVLRFGVIGDTQIGSMYQRLDAMGAFYEHCRKEGIKIICHTGDVIDGWRVYRGQEFELHPNGRSWPEQRKMFIDNAPRIDGITTIFITGNHDASFKKLVGLVVGDELQSARPDWHFIGATTGQVVLKTKKGLKFKVQLLHPGGGTAYAVSYHAQKIIEAMSGGQKPQLVCVGHYHKSLYMPAYRNVSCILSGCFQSQTPYMLEHSLAAHIGGWVVTVTLNEPKKLTSRVETEWIGFYEEER